MRERTVEGYRAAQIGLHAISEVWLTQHSAIQPSDVDASPPSPSPPLSQVPRLRQDRQAPLPRALPPE